MHANRRGRAACLESALGWGQTMAHPEPRIGFALVVGRRALRPPEGAARSGRQEWLTGRPERAIVGGGRGLWHAGSSRSGPPPLGVGGGGNRNEVKRARNNQAATKATTTTTTVERDSRSYGIRPSAALQDSTPRSRPGRPGESCKVSSSCLDKIMSSYGFQLHERRQWNLVAAVRCVRATADWSTGRPPAAASEKNIETAHNKLDLLLSGRGDTS
jgi:hypothetical protein